MEPLLQLIEPLLLGENLKVESHSLSNQMVIIVTMCPVTMVILHKRKMLKYLRIQTLSPASYLIINVKKGRKVDTLVM